MGVQHIRINQPLNLDQAKAAKWEYIKAERDRREQLPLDYLGKQLDFDPTASERLKWALEGARAAIANGNKDFSIEWTCADNTVLPLTAQQMLDLPIAVVARGNSLHEHARGLRKKVDEAKTMEDLDKIVW